MFQKGKDAADRVFEQRVQPLEDGRWRAFYTLIDPPQVLRPPLAIVAGRDQPMVRALATALRRIGQSV
ncbi:MAG: hypothetical protein OWS74_08490, partial [Firmicutes bacterium]|nr:hypothetical protein [Bacillota bacterium]